MSLPKLKIDENQYLQGYKIKIYPDKADQEFIDRCIDTGRFVYNWVIDKEKSQYELYKAGLVTKEESFLSIYTLDREFTELRNSDEYEFLRLIPHNSGRSAIRHAVIAFERFFNKYNKYPKYKKKKFNQGTSYKTRADRMHFDGKYLRIEGLPKNKMILTGYDSGLTKAESKKIKFINPIISRDNLGYYYISFNLIKDKPLSYFDDNGIEFSEEIGIDLNKKKRCVLSNGIIYMAPDYSRALRRVRKFENIVIRDIIREKRREKNNLDNFSEIPRSGKAEKRLRKYRKACKRLHNINENFVEETTTKIIRTRPKAIVMEHLDIKGSIMNKHYMAKQMQFVNFYNFRITLQQKADKYGIKFIEAPQLYPPSKMCSNCGNIDYSLKSGQKIYNCKNCGLIIDRDLNASINLKNYAFKSA